MSHDIEHNQETSSTKAPSVHETRATVFPEKRSRLDRLGRKGIVSIAAGALGLTLAAGLGGMKLAQSSHDIPTHTDPTAEAPAVPGQENTKVAIPAEAKDFVTRYANSYTDPLATYYSEEAFIKANPGPGIVIDNDYIAGYNPNTQPFSNGEVSPLGYKVERLSPDKPVDINSSIEVFNSSIPNLNLLINMLSKNPSPQALEVIKNEFSLYSGLGNKEAGNLVDLLQGVTSKYGSNALYTINAGVERSGDSVPADATVVLDKTPGIDAVDDKGNTTAFSLVMNMSISVDTYNDSGEKTHTTDVLNNAQFTVVKATNYDPLGNGYIGIGAR